MSELYGMVLTQGLEMIMLIVEAFSWKSESPSAFFLNT